MAFLQAGKTKIYLHIESENENITNTVSAYPVQSGSNMADHTQRDSKTWSLDGKLLITPPKPKYKKVTKIVKVKKGKKVHKVKKTYRVKVKTRSMKSQANAHYAQLVKWQARGTLVKYFGAMNSGTVMIKELNRVADDGGYKNGYKITMTLQQVNIIGWGKKKRKHAGVKKPHKGKRKSKKVYVTVKPGNTYWGWSMKYGTSISTLRKWNRWPDRRIPIGKKARVK